MATNCWRLCFMYLSDWQLAEDALQETFLKVFRKYDTFAGRSSEKTWLVRIAVNVCKDYLRGNGCAGWIAMERSQRCLSRKRMLSSPKMKRSCWLCWSCQ